jgi:hypothetical protein
MPPPARPASPSPCFPWVQVPVQPAPPPNLTQDPVKEEPTRLKPIPESSLSRERATENLSPGFLHETS